MRGSPSLGSPSLGSHVHKENIRAAFNPEDAATRPGFKRAARQPLGCERRQNSTEKRTKQLRSFSYLSLIVMAVARAICRSLLYVAAAARERRSSPEMASFWWRGHNCKWRGPTYRDGCLPEGVFLTPRSRTAVPATTASVYESDGRRSRTAALRAEGAAQAESNLRSLWQLLKQLSRFIPPRLSYSSRSSLCFNSFFCMFVPFFLFFPV